MKEIYKKITSYTSLSLCLLEITILRIAQPKLNVISNFDNLIILSTLDFN